VARVIEEIGHFFMVLESFQRSLSDEMVRAMFGMML
jgi:hypothetical protein